MAASTNIWQQWKKEKERKRKKRSEGGGGGGGGGRTWDHNQGFETRTANLKIFRCSYLLIFASVLCFKLCLHDFEKITKGL